ncbi:hypothetical protein JW752_02460 [Candidatus Peregrinibacteria bacterium]|nr:hypothetical protein [Candidatus Peregrinibacteria bacterium]
MGNPEKPKCTVLRVKVKTIQIKDGRIRIVNEGDEEPCDPIKVRRLVRGKRIETKKAVESGKTADGQPENEASDPELDAILEDFIKNMP